MSQGTGFWVTALSDANGNVALDVPVGIYNLTISASGQKDLVRNDVVVTTGINELEDLSMTPVDNWTLIIIVVVVIVVVALLLVYFFYLRKKPEAEEHEEEPKADEKSKGKK
jgi:beta-lactamase regulating signal transducer with metallopeptidase domain